jgi:hypothetical protein
MTTRRVYRSTALRTGAAGSSTQRLLHRRRHPHQHRRGRTRGRGWRRRSRAAQVRGGPMRSAAQTHAAAATPSGAAARRARRAIQQRLGAPRSAHRPTLGGRTARCARSQMARSPQGVAFMRVVLLFALRRAAGDAVHAVHAVRPGWAGAAARTAAVAWPQLSARGHTPSPRPACGWCPARPARTNVVYRSRSAHGGIARIGERTTPFPPRHNRVTPAASLVSP